MLNSKNSRKEGEGELPEEEPITVSANRGWPFLRVSFLWIPLLLSLAAGCNKSEAPKGKGAGQKGSQGPTAVVIGTVAQKDVPIYRDGLGTVQAFNTVTVRSRVDGQLQKLTFKEGQ